MSMEKCVEDTDLSFESFIENLLETILVPTGTAAQEFNGMLSMTDTARFIWEHLETVQSLEEMVKIMLDTYEIDEKTATQDVIGFVNALLQHGMVTFSREDHTW